MDEKDAIRIWGVPKNLVVEVSAIFGIILLPLIGPSFGYYPNPLLSFEMSQ
jgi:hypothetical protein